MRADHDSHEGITVKYNLERSSHAVYSLHYHLVFVTKYRKPVLDNHEVAKRLNEIFRELQQSLDLNIDSTETDIDHVHGLFKGSPNTDLINTVKTLKGVSS